MNVLDIILLALIVLFGAAGYRAGFIQTLGGIVGIVVATIVAGKYYLWLASFLGATNLAFIISFLILFFVVIKLVSIVFWLLGKIFKIVAVLPFVDTFNKALGALLGLTQGVLALSVVVFFMNKYPLNSWFIQQIQGSLVADILLTVAVIFIPLLPDAIKRLKGVV